MKIAWISVGIIAFDQVTKYLVKQYMVLHESIPVIGSTIQLTYVENPGMAFGIRFFADHPFLGRWFFSIVSVAASILLIVYMFKTRGERLTYRLSLALILGGAVGNLIDRVLMGRVIDFVDIDIPNLLGMHRWPVFNVADSAVVTGMILMSAFILFGKSGAKEEEDRKLNEEIPVGIEKTQKVE